MPTAPTLDELQPMLLVQSRTAFNDPAWCFEPKYDGYRGLAEWGGGLARLKSRRGSDMTSWFPEVATALATVGGRRCVVDGEMCVLNEHGIAGDAEFRRLFKRQARRSRAQVDDAVVFCVFDVLVLDGRNVMQQPLGDRKTALKRLLDGVPNTLVVGHVVGEGVGLFREAVRLELEGVVAKRLDSPYQPGVRSRDWLKIKRPGAVPAERFRHG